MATSGFEAGREGSEVHVVILLLPIYYQEECVAGVATWQNYE